MNFLGILFEILGATVFAFIASILGLFIIPEGLGLHKDLLWGELNVFGLVIGIAIISPLIFQFWKKLPYFKASKLLNITCFNMLILFATFLIRLLILNNLPARP